MAVEIEIHKQLDGFALDTAFCADDGPMALLGASGSGKSMTLRCIAGVERPDSGRIVVNGRVLFDSARGIDLPPQKRQVGLLFQHYALFPDMTVYQNLRCGARRTGRAADLDALLERFDLQGLADRLPCELSGGQQQRVALARILASRPQLLLLDEPFSALDPALRWRVTQQVADVIAGFSGTTILVSHDREEVYRLTDQIAVMNSGRVGAVRAKAALFTQPHTAVEADLTGFENVVDAVRTDPHTLLVKGWGGVCLRCAAEVPAQTTGMAVRAGQIVRAQGAGENCILAQVQRCWDGAERNRVILMPAKGTERLCWDLAESLPAGQTVWLYLPPEAIIPLREV